MTLRSKLGRWKRGLRNSLAAPDPRFAYDYRELEDYMRVSFCSVREVGLRTRCMISERIVEYPLTFARITKPASLVLDIGSSESFLPYQLASMGHRVIASDLFPPKQFWRKSARRGHWVQAAQGGGYVLQHPNLRFVREDATRLGHDANCFDCVTAISTIEHFGCYGVRSPDPTAIGRRAMAEMRRVLKTGGTLLASVPFGTGGESKRNWLLQLVFDRPLLDSYLDGFAVAERRYFVFRDAGWVESSEAETARADCSTRTTGMCFVEARKP